MTTAISEWRWKPARRGAESRAAAHRSNVAAVELISAEHAAIVEAYEPRVSRDVGARRGGPIAVGEGRSCRPEHGIDAGATRAAPRRAQVHDGPQLDDRRQAPVAMAGETACCC